MDEVIFFLMAMLGVAIIVYAFYQTYIYGFNDGYADGYNSGYRESEHYEPRSQRLDRALGELAKRHKVPR